MLDFYTWKQLHARKEYVCSLCGRKIPIGEQYIRYSGKYDGRMFDYKHHVLCDKYITVYCSWAEDHEYDADSIDCMIRERVCNNCRHYNEDMDDFEEIDCNPWTCERVCAELITQNKKQEGL